MSGAWVIVRFPHVGDDLQPEVEQLILAEVESCPRCLQMYNLTGHVPTDCPDCGANRDHNWMMDMESRADCLSKNGVTHGT